MAGNAALFFVSLVFITFTPGVSTLNPGLVARITSAGLNYADTTAIKILTKEVVGQKIPDQSGKTHGVKYEVSQMVITGFSVPTSSISLAAGKGLTWRASGASLSANGHWHYKYHFVSDSGKFDVSVSDIQFTVSITLGVDKTGRPTINSPSCSSDIGSVHIKFHGGASFIYNLFSSYVEGIIKDQLKKQMCSQVQKAVDVDAGKALSKMPITVEINHQYILDYAFLTAPVFTSQYIETPHKGEIFWKGDMTESPFSAAPFTPSNTTGKMLYLWVSDYVINTIGYVANKHGQLRYNLTSKDLPLKDQYILNTTCPGFLEMCVGKLIPQIGKSYPNSHVEIEMYSTVSPNMTIIKNDIHLSFAGDLSFFARLTNKSLVHLFLMTANMTTHIKASVHDGKIFGSINQTEVSVNIKNTSIGPINQAALQGVMNLALKHFIEPIINNLGAKGIPLPIADNVKLVNTNLELAKDTLIIATDVEYVSAFLDENNDAVKPDPMLDNAIPDNTGPDMDNSIPLFPVLDNAVPMLDNINLANNGQDMENSIPMFRALDNDDAVNPKVFN